VGDLNEGLTHQYPMAFPITLYPKLRSGSFRHTVKVYVLSPLGTTSTVAIRSYLQISQDRALMVPIL
jgi:hypothetical protein